MFGAFLTALPVVAVIALVTWRCFADPSSTNFKCSIVDVPLRRRFSSTTHGNVRNNGPQLIPVV
jgi:hypothetical protein